MSAPTWNDKFDFPDGLDSIADIQRLLWIYHQKHKTLAEHSPIQIYPNPVFNQKQDHF